MCAIVAGPVSFANVSFHVSVWPVSVPLKRPCAALSRTTCFGTSWPDESAAVHTVVLGAADESTGMTSPMLAAVASTVRSLLMSPPFRERLVPYRYPQIPVADLKICRTFTPAGSEAPAARGHSSLPSHSARSLSHLERALPRRTLARSI